MHTNNGRLSSPSLAITLTLSLVAGCFALEEEQTGHSEQALGDALPGLQSVEGSDRFPPDCACNEIPAGESNPPVGHEPSQTNEVYDEQYNEPYNEQYGEQYNEEPNEPPVNEEPAPTPAGDGEPEFPSPIPGGEKGKTPYDQGKTNTCGYVALHNAELKFGADLDKLAKAIDACLEKRDLKPVFKKGGIQSPPGSAHWEAYLECKTEGLAAQGIKVEFFESTPYWLPTTQTVNPNAPRDKDGERPTYTSEQVKAAVSKFCEDIKETLDAGGAVTLDYDARQAAAEHVVTVQSIECPPSGGMKVTFTDPNDPGTTATMGTNPEGEITTCTPSGSAACNVATGDSGNRVVRALHERPAD